MKDKYTVLLAGNPNVGKSTIFNALTGMKQHTGNWVGKTVTSAAGKYKYHGKNYILMDLPGTYSLYESSPDEKAATQAIYKGNEDCVIIAADASNAERNLDLVIQILEINTKAVLCLNLYDEAEKKGIEIDIEKMSELLGIPVVKTAARSKKGIKELQKAVEDVCSGSYTVKNKLCVYDNKTEEYIKEISGLLKNRYGDEKSIRRAALHILKSKAVKMDKLCNNLDISLPESDEIRERISRVYIEKSREIASLCIKQKETKGKIDIDKIVVSKKYGIPIMILLFSLILYITIIGANYPSELLAGLFDSLKGLLIDAGEKTDIPYWLRSIVIDGAYTTLADVVSVMLPPMAIFFPLFTLLEDSGYLPRVAFMLDPVFARSGTNGKTALTLMMGLGCNACGVTGCRIMGCPKQRNIAVITNNFVPCNGRFPTLIAIISVFMVGSIPVLYRSFVSTMILISFVLLSIGISFLVSNFISARILKLKKEHFIMELPPYRMPQIGKTIVRSIFDRTIFILGRAVIVAIPAGIIIWILANVYCGDKVLIKYVTDCLDPPARLMGLDGAILTGFILGFPANEIVFPIILMIYQSGDKMLQFGSLEQLRDILILNGWNIKTAVCMLIFTLMHFPCSTTMITIWKETKSIKWTAAGFIIPTLCGIISCIIANLVLTQTLH